MQLEKRLMVYASFDDEAGVWVATSDDIPGLVTEDASLDNLVRRVNLVIPELLMANATLLSDAQRNAVEFCVVTPIGPAGVAAA